MEDQRPVHLDRIGREFPDLKLIVAHLGHPWVDEGIAVVAKHPNFYTEMSGWAAYGMAPHQPVEEIYKALKKLKYYDCLDKVMFGSDNSDCVDMYPLANEMSREKDGVELYSEETLSKIMGGTAAELFKIGP
tara:strand:- start:29 stop:424 length:396 start_codon:yes stop_codon:yes gene_type:complete